MQITNRTTIEQGEPKFTIDHNGTYTFIYPDLITKAKECAKFLELLIECQNARLENGQPVNSIDEIGRN